MQLFQLLVFNGLSYIAIILLFYIIVWGFTRHIFDSVKIYYEIILGILFSLFSIVFNIFLQGTLKGNELLNNNYEIIYLLPILVFWTVTVFISLWSSAIVLATNLLVIFSFYKILPEFFKQIENQEILILIMISYFLILFLMILKTFVYRKINTVVIWSSTTLACLMYIFIRIIPHLSAENNWNTLLILSVWLVLGYILYGFVVIVEKIYNHALRLKNIVKFENDYYLNYSSKNSFLLEQIFDKNIKYGIYIHFFVSNYELFEKNLNSATRESIMKNITDQIYQLFVQKFPNAVFFKENYKTYGLFLPLETYGKIIKNPTKFIGESIPQLEELICKLKLDFFYNSYKISLQIKNSVAFFGVDSNDFKELSYFNQYNERFNKSLRADKLNVINVAKIHQHENIKHQINALSSSIDLNLFTPVYKPIYSCEASDYIGYEIDYAFEGYLITEKVFEENMRNIQKLELNSLFTRYISLIGVKRYKKDVEKLKNKKVFIKYDLNTFCEKTFDVEEFILKLEENDVNFQNLYLGFDYLFEIKNVEVFQKNIEKILQCGIKTFIFNYEFDKEKIQYVLLTKPSYVWINNENWAKYLELKVYVDFIESTKNIFEKLGIEVIFTNVRTYNDFKKIKEKGVKLVQGELFEKFYTPSNIGKELKYLLNK
ncbi:EAL domain-containing protein [Spiroplasma endosymbiont of Crioceris asparagi]|uniref:EAL domain-containing protein n=1 Tax=Spiroplasma endosymbiont of Crioceris asparagi TaxID=3066286 RepID=UPI0030D16F62